jgi:hypothetical protein
MFFIRKPIVYAAVCIKFSMYLCKQFSRLDDLFDTCAWKTYHIRLHVQYGLPDDEPKMLETCKRQKELN